LNHRWNELTSAQLADRIDADRIAWHDTVGATEQHAPPRPHFAGLVPTPSSPPNSPKPRRGSRLVVLPAACLRRQLALTAPKLAGRGRYSGEETAAAASLVARACVTRVSPGVVRERARRTNAAAVDRTCDGFRRVSPTQDRRSCMVGPMNTTRPARDRTTVDWHANAAETSIMWALRPELVDNDRCKTADDPDRTEARLPPVCGQTCPQTG